jgi:hypothetical protein
LRRSNRLSASSGFSASSRFSKVSVSSGFSASNEFSTSNVFSVLSGFSKSTTVSVIARSRSYNKRNVISLTTTDLRRIAHSIILLFCSENPIKPPGPSTGSRPGTTRCPLPLHVEVRRLIPVPSYRHNRLRVVSVAHGPNMPELQQVRVLVGLPSAQAEVLDRDPDQYSLVMLSVFRRWPW